MWNIKEVKEKGRKTLKKNLWTLIVLSLFMTIVVGEYLTNKDGFSNLKIIYEYIQNKDIQEITPKETLVNEYVDKAISQLFTGNMTSLIDYYNQNKWFMED